MNRNRLLLASFILLIALFLTGCFSTRNAIFFDENWDAHMAVEIITDDFGPSKEELADIVARMQLFFPEFEQVEAGKNSISYLSSEKLGLGELAFVEKEGLADGTTKLIINLPALITAKDWQGDAKGAPMFLELYLPGRIIEANTLDFQNDYPLEKVFPGEKRGKVMWQLSKEHLTAPLRLWVTLAEK